MNIDYETIAKQVGWETITYCSWVLMGIGCWFLLRHIGFLKDEKLGLERRLNDAKENRPDTLAIQLAQRLRDYEEELDRMRHDKAVDQTTIRAKEAEIANIQKQIEELKSQVEKASDLLKTVIYHDLVCPNCGAPLISREGVSEMVEYGDIEVEVDHEFSRFECGYETVDGRGAKDCPRSRVTKSEGK